MDGLSSLLDTSGFVPRWHCGSWSAFHGWLHIVADVGICGAYIAIPCVLGVFLWRRKDLPFRIIFLLFSAFILSCGLTHLMEAVIFWWPLYRLAGVVKLVTAVVSWGTVVALVPVIPKALTMRTLQELEDEIQERKGVEESLRQSEERFRLLVEATTEYAIFMLDPQGYVISWHAGAQRMKGYRAEEIVGYHFSRFYVQDDVRAGKPQKDIQTALEQDRCEDEGWQVRKDRSLFWASTVLTPVRDANGNLRGFSKITRDLTERKRAEAALEKSRRFVERVADTIPNILYVYDLKEKRNVFVNHRVESMLGFSTAETTGTDAILRQDRIYPDDWPRVEWSSEQLLTAEDNAVVETEFRIRHADGQWRWLRSRDTVFVRDADADPVQILGTAEDITQRKRLEQEVVEVAASEQRRIGQELHDGTGQELTGLSLLANDLADALRDHAPAEAQLANRIAHGLGHALGHVRALSRGLIPVEVDAEGLMAALSEFAGRISELHAVNCTFTCVEPVPVEDNFVATQLYRIAQEAITNVLKHAQAANIRVSLETKGRFVTLRIADDGIGMPQTDEQREGMGLRIMRYRASQIGAQFSVHPAALRGTVVTCTLFRGTSHE